MIFLQLAEKEKIDIINQMHEETNLSQVIIEKDLWVTAVLRALFALPYADNLSFKGGTSLSKCYNLIERFSEDVDIAINREFFGFVGDTFAENNKNSSARKRYLTVGKRLQQNANNDLRKAIVIWRSDKQNNAIKRTNKQLGMVINTSRQHRALASGGLKCKIQRQFFN